MVVAGIALRHVAGFAPMRHALDQTGKQAEINSTQKREKRGREGGRKEGKEGAREEMPEPERMRGQVIAEALGRKII